jgi:hypothetical protein
LAFGLGKINLKVFLVHGENQPADELRIAMEDMVLTVLFR